MSNHFSFERFTALFYFVCIAAAGVVPYGDTTMQPRTSYIVQFICLVM